MPTPRFVQLTFLPLMATLAGTGAWIASSGRSEVLVAAVGVLAVTASFAAERVVPYRFEWNRGHGDTRRDLAHALVNEGTVLATVALLPILGGRLTIVDLWPATWPFGLQVLLAIVVADLGITVTHRISHQVGWLWRLHAVHHSVTRFYGFNGLLKHPLHQAVELSAGVAPLVLIGLPGDVAAALALCVVIQLLLQHSNVDYAVGPAGRWLALNHAHRFHHVQAAGQGDVNFGLFTTVWDRWLLHTYRWSPSEVFTSEDFGVTGRPDYPVRYLPQLREPFRRTSPLLSTATPPVATDDEISGTVGASAPTQHG